MITLKNDQISITVAEKGAEIIEGKYIGGKDFIWMGDENWPDHSPTLFPICGTMIDNKRTHGGKEYSMKIHGFAQNFIFTVEEKTEQSLLLSLTYSEETLKYYPFKFKFFVRYTIDGKTVTVEHRVENLDDGDIYFSFGSHEGYYVPDGVENYYLELDGNRTLSSMRLDGPYLRGDYQAVIENERKIPLGSDKYHAYDLIFLNIDFSAITLYHNSGKKIVRAEFEGYPNLLVWSEKGSRFVCIEPWHGLPDYSEDTADREFTHKKGLIRLEKGKDFSRRNKFTVA